ncbi:MAG TPA: uroporphyrinogen decarboxylase family protein [Accumulibacter sp.]|uniref:uroporphyrinogen decarboxylase family protein n=2 Tax=Accumulibacter sp. TaxID=2053492 RepID=UPI002C48638D|nr:uroporphyrinogen decarboxylase family protein [Accumulibacter sp.]HMV06073.1 uroporphyrinogen decarboxylase family protein [Accumulibacter sp.]HMW79375.1 uroporphyrinogen decarboxylase family protein [Accumulibacter sp.]HNE38659.1 uroporphyrinogen decarboxylase family protein [Accumulibacter sp.]HNG14350.1 uroporphyrinogen decarboxylase family protein [Accumulibacter sp.]HNH91085.1 uroporphyrinogen decarboxylase family protein [Accumulibacter sp.]
MHSAARFNNLLHDQPTDRRVFTLVLSLYGARLTACPLDQHYTDPVAYARGQSAVRETFQPDVLFAPVSVALIGAAFGGKLRYLKSNAPTIAQPAIESAGDWQNLHIPDPERQPHLVFVREALRRMVAEHRDQVPVAALFLTPVDIPMLVMGMDAWMDAVLFDRQAARRIARGLIPFFVSVANGYFDDGAAYLVLPCAFASPSIVPRTIVEQFSRPIMAEALAQLRGPVALHHLDPPLLPHLDLLADLPAVGGFSLASADNLSQARALLGRRPILLGGPEVRLLRQGSTGEVEAACRAVLEDRRDDPRFILCNSGADLWLDTPPENIHAVRRAVESWASER